jgi:hypothetical protein
VDEGRFDSFARAVAAPDSRRRLLAVLLGGAVGLVGVRRGEASAAGKRSAGNSCKLNADCASGLCVQEGRTRKICHCATVTDCPTPRDPCLVAACTAQGACGAAPVVCPTGQTCCGGVCKGATNAPCSIDGDCCSGDCGALNGNACCPVCPIDCFCGTSQDRGNLCTNGETSNRCIDSTGCQATEACMGGVCTTTCPSLS